MRKNTRSISFAYRGSTYEDNLKSDQLKGGIASVALSRSQPPSLVSMFSLLHISYLAFQFLLFRE